MVDLPVEWRVRNGLMANGGLRYTRARSRRNLKTKPSPLILYLCLEKLGQRNHMFIVISVVKNYDFASLRFEDRLQKMFRFRAGLVCTVGLPLERN